VGAHARDERLDRRERPRRRGGREPAAVAQAFAQTRAELQVLELLDAAVRVADDQTARGVGAERDDRSGQ
jgi:hypothetical protein